MLQAMAFAFWSTVFPTVDYSPSQLAFGCDIILDWKVAVDFDQVKWQHANNAKCNNEKENATQTDHEYKVGDCVLIIKWLGNKTIANSHNQQRVHMWLQWLMLMETWVYFVKVMKNISIYAG